MAIFDVLFLMALSAPTDIPVSRNKADVTESMAPANHPGSWVTNEDYPVRAIIEEREGISGFLLTIDTKGLPTNCTITSSSGSADLDEATCQLLMARARFTPGHDAKGMPTGGTYSNRIRWQIPKDEEGADLANEAGFQMGPFDKYLPQPPFPTSETLALDPIAAYPKTALTHGDEGLVGMALTISDTGSVTDCVVAQSSNAKSLDEASCKLMRDKAKFNPALDSKGAPTAGTIAVNFNWILPEAPPDADESKLADALNDLPARRPAFPMKEPGKTILSLTVTADGAIADCHFDGEGAFVPPDKTMGPCMMFGKETRFAPFLDKDGKPEARHFILRTDLSVDPVDAKASVGGN